MSKANIFVTADWLLLLRCLGLRLSGTPAEPDGKNCTCYISSIETFTHEKLLVEGQLNSCYDASMVIST